MQKNLFDMIIEQSCHKLKQKFEKLMEVYRQENEKQFNQI